MTDTALPLGPGFLVDLDRPPSADAAPVDQGAGACLDHVARPGARRKAGAGRLHRLGRVAVVPVLDLVVAGLVSGLAVGLWGAAAPVEAALLVGWLVALVVAGGYDDSSGATGSVPFRAVLRAGSAVALLCWVTASLAPVPVASAPTLTSLALLVGGSLAVRRVAAGTLGRVAGVRRVVVVGRVPDVERTIEDLGRTPEPGRVEVAAACVPDVREAGSLPLPVFRGIERAASAAADVAADAVVVLPGVELDPAVLRRLGWQLEGTGIDLCVRVPLPDICPARAQVAQTGGMHVLHVRGAELRGARKVLKHGAERAAAALLLVALLPLMLLVAVAVRHDSPGPALFRQTRVGSGGRHFTMYKFRTMATDAEQRLADLMDANEVDGALFKLRSDPRITRFGGFLRRYSLDELPQLANVVLGHMALVGPRPALPSEVAQYEPDTHRRLAVRPGLTGLWQVSGRSDLSWEQAVGLDLHYVDNWSFALDLRIFCLTLGAVLGQRGAY